MVASFTVWTKMNKTQVLHIKMHLSCLNSLKQPRTWQQLNQGVTNDMEAVSVWRKQIDFMDNTGEELKHTPSHTFSLFTDDNTVAQQRDDQWHCELDWLNETDRFDKQFIIDRWTYTSIQVKNLKTKLSHHNQLSNNDIAMYTVYLQTGMTNNLWNGSNCTTQWHHYTCTLSTPRQIWQTILETVQIAPLELRQ